MSDLSPLFGRAGGGFTADPRFVGLPDEPGDPPPMMALLGARCRQEAAPPARQSDPLEFARAEAYAQGLADARAEADAEATAADTARQRLALSFARLDAELAEQLAQRLTETVAALCEATLAPLALDAEALARRVHRAVAMFARAEDERVIRLNPEDLALVAPLLPAEWLFHSDATLERGALRVETQSGGVEDGPAEWARAIREALDPGAGK